MHRTRFRTALPSLACLAGLALLSVNTDARADAADDAFARGLALGEANKLTEAEASFEEAWSLRRSWDIAGNLGFVEAALGKWDQAAEHLEYAVVHIGGLAKPEQKAQLEKRFDEAKQHVATIKIETAAHASVTVDDRVVGDAPLDGSIFLAPGKHALGATLEGFEPGRAEVDATAGESKTITLQLTAKAGAGLPPPGESRPMWPGWVIGGVGLASAGLGAALLGVGQAKVGDAGDIGDGLAGEGDDCGADGRAGGADCQSGRDDLDHAAALSTGGAVMLGVGGALLVGGIIYLALPDAHREEARFVPWISPETGGAVFQGVF